MLYWGGVICTGASAQTKAIEVTSAGNMRFYGDQDIRFGNNENWGMEYYGGLNFFRKKTDGSWADYQLYLKDDGNVGIGTSTPKNTLDVRGTVRSLSGFVLEGDAAYNYWNAVYLDNSWSNRAANLYPHTDCSLIIGREDRRVQVFAKQVWAVWFTTTSDERVKENIHSIESPLSKITKLKGVQYDIRKSYVSDSVEHLRKGKRDSRKDNLGLLAQDLQKVFPELVSENDSSGLLGINYIGLIPVLVEALKEQQVQIAMLQQQVAVLGAGNDNGNTGGNNGKSKLKSGSADSETNAATKTTESIVLFQNTPNPFSTSTEIAMELPADVQDAKLAIYNLAGEQKLSITVAERGAASVRIEAGQLMPGIYIYGIIADGQLAVSKQMVVTE